MLLSALDPALLFYRFEDWLSRQVHCRNRFDAMALHKRICSKFDLKTAISDQMTALVFEHFPYEAEKRQIPEARDLRLVIDRLLQMSHPVMQRSSCKAVLKPEGVVAQHIRLEEIVNAWNEILGWLCTQGMTGEFCPQIATWDNVELHRHAARVILAIAEDEVQGEMSSFELPLVWDEDSWFAQLATLDLWDISNLDRSVEVHFKACPFYRQLSGVKEKPTPFRLSPAFEKELAKHCATDKALQRAFIEALTKLVHRIPDPSLGDEVIQSRRRGGERRFRITCAGHPPLRGHYHFAGGTIILDRFGPHRIDGID